MRRVRELLLQWKSNKYYIFVCVRACVRVCERWIRCVRVRVCVCVRECRCRGAWARVWAYAPVDLFIQHVTRMRHIVT